ncbi:MAG: hypothetical protein GXP62_03120 [Oligoflexia bacterium]|nr:hypothetical protein [Oligoflexia bacterium]
MALLSVALLGAGPARAAIVDRVAAAVNDDIVTLSDVYDLGGDFIEQRAAKGERRAAELEVLDTLVRRSLISQEVKRLDIDVTDVDLDRAIDDIARRNNLERERLRTEVEKSGMSWTQYRDELRQSLREQQFNSYITQTRISVDEDELRDAYQRAMAERPEELSVHLGAFVLLFPPGADADQQAAVYAAAQAAADRVNGGEDFATVAAQVDQGSFGSNGGEMGNYKRGELVEQLDQIAFDTPVGQASVPVVTDRGVFVLYPFQRDPIPQPTFEEMREELQNKVYSDRIKDETDQWYQAARRQASVEIKLEKK